MFKKILIANRGEIAVRVIRACRELGIPSLAIYEPDDILSLHVRLADECAPLTSSTGFLDGEAILKIAIEKGADAVHPGYGYLGEDPVFIQACEQAGLSWIGPPAGVVKTLRCKTDALRRAGEAGIPTVPYSPGPFYSEDLEALRIAAEALGYPVVLKSCSGGRGPGQRLVYTSDRLERAARRCLREAERYYGLGSLYLEKAILPAYEIDVQVLRDRNGSHACLGEIQALVQHGNRRVIAESPAPVLADELRQTLWQKALELASLLDYQNLGTVEFLVDEAGRYYFTEFKARLQLEHLLIELLRRVDLVRLQVQLAAGEPLPFRQEELLAQGTALVCRVNAEDPWNDFLPSPGVIEQMRLPGGPEVRVDTYGYSGCKVPEAYDPLVAKLAVWGETRQAGLDRMRRALEEFQLTGVESNLSLLQNILNSPEFALGQYPAPYRLQLDAGLGGEDLHRRDLAAAAAVVYLLRQACASEPHANGRGMSIQTRRRRVPPSWAYSGIPYDKTGSIR
jgi:acetyl/propionyl-CoA carboxylase alpha subunit